MGFKKLLQNAVKIYEDKVPEKLKAWRPGSDKKFWDLVLPFRFPLVCGRTCVLSNGADDHLGRLHQTKCCQGEITEVPPEKEIHEATKRVQWPRKTHLVRHFNGCFVKSIYPTRMQSMSAIF